MKNMITALAIAGALVGLILVAITIFPGAKELPDLGDVGDDIVVAPGGSNQDPEKEARALPPPVGNVPLAGTVKTEAGVGVEGAEIVAFFVETTSAPSRIVKTVKSVQGGVFDFGGLAAGKYRFAARMVGFQEETIERTLFAADDKKPLEFVLKTGAVIAGRVFDLEQKPIREATIRAYFERINRDDDLATRLALLTTIMDMKSEKGVEAKSDESGFFQITGLRPGAYRLIATAKGFAHGALRFVPVGTTDANFALEVGGVLNGTVTDIAMAAISDATIEVKATTKETDLIEVVLQSQMPPLAATKSDAAGRFRFEELGGGGEYELKVSARGFQPQELQKVVVHKGGHHDLPIQLTKGLTIAGTVYGPDGRTVEGAVLKATRTGVQVRGSELANSNVKSDAAGRFAFDTLQEGEYRVVASHEEYASWSENKVKPSDDNFLDVRLGEGATVTGQIRDAATGQGIPGAIAAAQDVGEFDKRAVADATGYYVLRGVTVPKRGSSATFTYEADGYSRLSNIKVDVVDRETTANQDAELEKNGSVAGVVVDSAGKPLAGVKVTVKRQHSPSMPVIVNVGDTVESSSAGEFTISDVRPGEEGYVSGTHPKFLESISEPFDLKSGENLKGVKLVMSLGGSVTGIVVSAATGEPIAGATVAVSDDTLSEENPSALPKRAIADKEGRFTIISLNAGTHTLIASAQGFLRAEQKDVAVEEERSTDIGKLSLENSSYVAGRVISTNGDAVAGAKVTVIDNSDGYKKHNTTTNSNGEFRVEELGQQPVTVEASAKGHAKAIVPDVPVENDTLEITLERLGAIHGFVLDEQGAPLAAFSVQPKINRYGHSAKAAQAKTFQSADGSYTFDELEAGSYEIGVGAMGYSYERLGGIQVFPEQTTEVRAIVLRQGGKIAGWVTDAVTGEPLDRASISIIGGGKELIANNSDIKTTQGRSSTTTDAQGYFELTGLGRTSVSVKARKDGYVEEIKKIAGGNMEINIALQPGGALQGYVYGVDGEVVAGQTLLLMGTNGFNERGVSDRNGRYYFPSLRAGDYTIRLSSLAMGSERDFGSPEDMARMDDKELQRMLRERQSGDTGTRSLGGDRKELERQREEREQMKDMTPEEREEYMRERAIERQNGGGRGAGDTGADQGDARGGSEISDEKLRRGMKPEEAERYDNMTPEQQEQYREHLRKDQSASAERNRGRREERGVDGDRSKRGERRTARGPLVGNTVYNVSVYAGQLNEFDIYVEE